MYLMMEKQHNRGQDGAGYASVKLNMNPGERYINRVRSCKSAPIQDIFSQINEKINSDSCQDSEAFTLKHWNYHWQKSYGSAQYRPSDDQVGVESLQVEEVKVHSNQRTIDLAVPGLRPVDQLHLTLQIESAEGEDFAEEIYWTIHRILDQ